MGKDVQGVNTKSILGYLIMPRVFPRMKRLFGSGFSFLAVLLAQLYAMVRLLPLDHEYLNPENAGKFGVRHVIVAAADNLVIKKENIDQILIFSAILIGVVLLIAQVFLLAYSLLVSPAAAQLTPPANLFDTPGPTGGGNLQDMAFILLDKVFGVPDFFCNVAGDCTDVLANGMTPFHNALHSLLQFYSTCILLIGMVIFLYFVLVVVFETAATGTPFGQRFQNGWVPIRLVVALGLLVPITHGLNSAQYITLFAAKFGSGLATNGWILFNNTIQSSGTDKTPVGEKSALMALPTPSDLTPILQAMSMVHACAYAYWHTDEVQATSNRPLPPSQTFYIRPYLVKKPESWMINQLESMELTSGVSYTQALDFYSNSDIFVRFGKYDPTALDKLGQIEPLCGEIRIPIVDLTHRGETNVGGPEAIQQYYFNLVKLLWHGSGSLPNASSNDLDYATELSQRYMAVSLRHLTRDDPATILIDPKPMECTIGCGNADLPSCSNITVPYATEDCDHMYPSMEARQILINKFNNSFAMTVKDAWMTYNQNTTDFDITDDVLALGWGGAGSWYNKINQINGSFIGSVMSIPMMVTFPSVMEKVRTLRREEDQKVRGIDQFEPNKANGEAFSKSDISDNDLDRAKALYNYYTWWIADDANFARPDKQITGRAFEDIMNAVFGTHNLMAMRGENAHIHPMAQLTALGKGLIDSAIMNVTASGGTALIAGLFQNSFGPTVNIMSEFLSTTAFLGLTAGFILYYILPFMPFLYFFFALGEWVKAIFEAMVGVPLWALAHLRISGEGLPGQSAASGYFLIFDIFLRPILTVFGLIAAMVIFTGQVRILHLIWDLVVDNLTGFSAQSDDAVYDMYDFTVQRGVVDNFFFTIVYATIMYMLATASFKLIDSIPDNMLRWMQGGVSTFGDMNNSQHIEQINQYAAISGISFGQQAVGASRQLMQGTGGILSSLGARLGGK